MIKLELLKKRSCVAFFKDSCQQKRFIAPSGNFHEALVCVTCWQNTSIAPSASGTHAFGDRFGIDIEEISMKVKDCMKRKVYTVSPGMTVGAAAQTFAEKHIGTLPVVDVQGKLVGLLQLRDLLELVLPDFLRLVDDLDFIHSFGAVEMRTPSAETLARPVSSVMEAPVSVNAESGMLRAVSLLHKHQLHDLPVVDENNVLVGIASRVDLGAAFVANWNVTQGGG
jgi:CBS-domain-containing membrane protein